MFCVKISVDLGYRRLPEGEVMGRAAKQNVIASPPRIKGHIHTYICFFFFPFHALFKRIEKRKGKETEENLSFL